MTVPNIMVGRRFRICLINELGIYRAYLSLASPQLLYNLHKHQRRYESKHIVFTLGAKLTIFPHPFILRSALTTPPIRDPNISLLLFNSTAALSSNRTVRPSGRRTAFLVRTMTARRTSPLRTFTAVADACAAAEIGRARITMQTISSPTDPQPLLTFCLRTLTHSTRRAPELSMTCELVRRGQTRNGV